MYKVVIDTNILISASYDEFSYAWKIIDLVIQGKIKAVASEKILKENRLIIERAIKNKRDKQEIENFLARVEVVPVYKKIKAVKFDPEDDKFIECAAEVGADFIISSDSHLLELGEYGKTKILTPKDFWFLYCGKKKDKDDEWRELFKDMFRK